MKASAKAILTFILVLFVALAGDSAMAQHGGGHYGHGGGVHYGFSFGVPLYAPSYYPYAPYSYYPAYGYPAPAYGYPPVAVAPSLPSAYVEQATAPSASGPVQPQGDWYYCADSKSYYPYVQDCHAGWQRVPAQPPPS
jgi:hypothetical protein